MKDTVVIVTTCDRPAFLLNSLHTIKKLGVPILVVDDSRAEASVHANASHAGQAGALYLRLPQNRGLAAALNIGLSFWLADKDVQWVSYLQDDVVVDVDLLEVLKDVQNYKDRPFLTGHDAREHKGVRRSTINGVDIIHKESCRATHMHAHRDYWMGVMPIPTRELGAPKRIPGQRGIGSNVDWWVASWAPTSVKETKKLVTCVPGLVRTFSSTAEESTWNNGVGYVEPELSRDALKGWRR